MEDENKDKPATAVRIINGGPLVISGKILYRDLKRDTTGNLTDVKLCLCGGSQNSPFCDESHSSCNPDRSGDL